LESGLNILDMQKNDKQGIFVIGKLYDRTLRDLVEEFPEEKK